MATEVWDAGSYDRSFGYVSEFGRSLIELLDPVPGERILDLGCGTGELAADLADRGLEVVGIDADAAMIDTARRNHPQVSFHQADGHDFSLPAPVDAVLSNAALHWMLRPHEVVSQVRVALRPGGRFVGELGGQGNVAAIRAAVKESVAAAGLDPASMRSPWFFPSPAEYAAVLEGAGFRVRLLEHFDRPTPLDDCPGGVVDWLRMFGRELLADVPADRQEEVMIDAAQRCRSTLCRDGSWFADYVRLRFVATSGPVPA